MSIKKILKLDLDDSKKAELILLFLSNQECKTESPQKNRAVVVFTDKRGVFFGYTNATKVGSLTLKNARNCYYWAANSEAPGFMGLGSHGPIEGSKISERVGEIELNGVTAILPCTEQAVKAWEAGKWK